MDVKSANHFLPGKVQGNSPSSLSLDAAVIQCKPITLQLKTHKQFNFHFGNLTSVNINITWDISLDLQLGNEET